MREMRNLRHTRIDPVLSHHHHHVRSAEAGHSWDVHHRRIRLSGYHGEADRSHLTPSGRVHPPDFARARLLILLSRLQIGGGGTYANIGARIW